MDLMVQILPFEKINLLDYFAKYAYFLKYSCSQFNRDSSLRPISDLRKWLKMLFYMSVDAQINKYKLVILIILINVISHSYIHSFSTRLVGGY